GHVTYGRVLRDWLTFCDERGVSVFGVREQLKAVLSAYAAHRASGPEKTRFAATTWNQHMSVLSSFYAWAQAEGHGGAVPFSYAQARAHYNGQTRVVRANLAMRRVPRPHVSIKYLEAGFAAMFLSALAGLTPDGSADTGYRGRELTRNTAVASLALASGLRRQEFSYLLSFEVPACPPASHPDGLPILLAVPEGITKGRKFRTTWVDAGTLATVHGYLALDRAASTLGSTWRPPASWGEPLMVTEAGPDGGRVNGRKVKWAALLPAQRRRLVDERGGSCLLAVRGDGGPFTAWDTVFTRASERIRSCFEPRFPHVFCHKLRHSFAMATLEKLVAGFYAQVAGLAITGGDAGPDAALALYLAKSDPLMVLRDLLGHSSALTTEAYLRRLDTTRIYRDAYEQALAGAPAAERKAAGAEATAEFTDDTDPDVDGPGPQPGGR
ncbi:MAG: hypothetical protein ACRDND_09430, partial [Streptosporangiaceae bacterium]